MIKKFIFTLILLIASPCFAQESSGVVKEAQFLVENYQQIPKTELTSRYLKFLLVQQVVGSFDVENRSILELKFNDSIKRFDPQLFQGEQKEIITQAQNVLKELHKFSLSIRAEEMPQFLKNYHDDGLSIRKSLKDGLYHLPGEVARFAFAIVAVRITTCFGPSLAPMMHFQVPSDIKAFNRDPACILELAEMLQSPLFYIGFTGFVLSSRGASAGLLKLLRAIDPAQGKVSKAFIAFALPNIALAAGFFTDHIIQTLAHNENILACGQKLGAGTISSLTHNLDRASIGEDENGDKHLGFYDQLGSEHCKRAGRYLSSTQFWSEDMGVGVAGLITTSMALTGATIALNQIKKISFVFSVTGVGGFVVATARMTVFLGLFEIIGPIIKNLYYDKIMQPQVDQQYLNLKSTLNRIKSKKIEILSNKRCSKHYSGFLDGENLELCTKIPLVAELYSFRDYSQTWRTKRILGKFHESLSHWKKKITSFITHYFSAQEHLRILSRSREVRLTEKSQFYREYESRAKKDLISFIKKNYPNESSPQNVFDHIKDLHDTYIHHHDSDVAKAAKDEADKNPNDRYIFDVIHQYEGHKELVANTLNGTPFFGLGAQITNNYLPELSLVQAVRQKAIRFLKSGISTRFLMQGGRPYNQLQRLHNLNLSPEEVTPYQPNTLVDMISSSSRDQVALGFVLLTEWMPFYFGEKSLSDDNPKAFNQVQQELFDDLTTLLSTFTPLFKYDAIYFESTGLNDYLFHRKKTPEDAQWDSQDFAVNTETLTDLSLAELMCGHQDNYLNLFLGDSGTGLEFKYPHLGSENYCNEYFYPIHYTGELLPAPSRTVFLTEDGFRTGLHQIYIQAPQGSLPHLFDSEEEAGQWWNETFRDPSLERLSELNNDYDNFLRSDFIPKFDTSGLSTFWKFMNRYNPFRNPFNTTISPIASSLNASETLFYELEQYTEIIENIYKADNSTTTYNQLEELKTCFVDMLSHISSKNYSKVKSQCLKVRNHIKDSLWYQNEKRSDALVQELLRKEEDQLSSDEIRDIILIHVYVHIEKLFSEVEMYQHIIDGQFKFNLDLEGDKK